MEGVFEVVLANWSKHESNFVSHASHRSKGHPALEVPAMRNDNAQRRARGKRETIEKARNFAINGLK